MLKHQIVFQPSGRRGSIESGKTVLQAAQELGVGIEAACGGKKVCGKCKIIIDEGRFDKLGIVSSYANASPIGEVEKLVLTKEELAKGYRLACNTVIQGDLAITVPAESRKGKQVILETGKEREVDVDPVVKNYFVSLEQPTLEDARDDRGRLVDALQQITGLTNLQVDYQVLRSLPRLLRQADWQVTATLRLDKNEIIKVRPGRVDENLGVAIDIGTTTLAAYLCELQTGQLLQKASRMNSQIGYGEDILARISFAMENEDGLERLNAAIIRDINELVAELTAAVGKKAEDVDEIVLVYNTAMHHFTLNLPTDFVGRSPFIPAASDALDIKARDLQIKINPAGWLHSLAIEAGFVGADNVAVLLAEEPYRSDKIKLVIDIGTNGEIDLGNKERLLSTSCATGPALEGAQIKFGMRAAPGAIERVRIDKSTLDPSYKVIGSDQWYPEVKHTGAKGICGSGIIDVIATMSRTGLIEKSGRLNRKAATDRMRRNDDGKLEYVLAWAEETDIGKDIVITQADIRAVQLAKAAIYTGARYLMEKYGTDHVDEVILAGAFGSYINKESALALGMFPDCDLQNVQAVGNAAGDGARQALLSQAKRKEAAWAARHVEFVETAVEADFQTKFMDALAIPHAKDKFVHLIDDEE